MNPAVVVASWPSGDDVGADAAVPSVAAFSFVEYTDRVVVDDAEGLLEKTVGACVVEDAGRLLEKTVDACVAATEDPDTESVVSAAEDPVEVTDGGDDPWAVDSTAVMVLDGATLTVASGAADV